MIPLKVREKAARVMSAHIAGKVPAVSLPPCYTARKLDVSHKWRLIQLTPDGEWLLLSHEKYRQLLKRLRYRHAN